MMVRNRGLLDLGTNELADSQDLGMMWMRGNAAIERSVDILRQNLPLYRSIMGSQDRATENR